MESPRDQDETTFTPILRRLFHRTTGLLAVCFVDGQGECIDYCAAIDPYDTKVVGAHLRVLIEEASTTMAKLMFGRVWSLHIHGTDRDVLGRLVTDEYLLATVLKPAAMSVRLLGGIEQAVSELREEAGEPPSSWERAQAVVRVGVRDAVGWAYAPSVLYDRGEEVAVTQVLGRWTVERPEGQGTCFRVRTAAGEELTLLHDRRADRWERQVF